MRNQLVRFFVFTSISAVLYFLVSVPFMYGFTDDMTVGVAYWLLIIVWAIVIPLSIVIALIRALDLWKAATPGRRVAVAALALVAQVTGLAGGAFPWLWPLMFIA